MATYEALFTDGTRLLLEADEMTVDDGLVVFNRDIEGKRQAVCVLGGDDLVACFHSSVTITWQEAEEDEYEEEEEE